MESSFFIRYFVFGVAGQLPVIGQIVSLINVLFVYRKDKRCVHDHLAGTIVIKAT